MTQIVHISDIIEISKVLEIYRNVYILQTSEISKSFKYLK